MIEEPELRRAMDDAELALYQDPRKTELYALKEEAYFSIDPKTNDTDLSERGRTFMNPNDPDMFVLPDLITRFHDIDANPSLSKEEKQRAKANEQASYDLAASASTIFPSCCAPTASTKRTSSTWCRTTRS